MTIGSSGFFDQLPQDLILQILQQLPLQDLKNLFKTGKALFLKFQDSTKFWNTLFARIQIPLFSKENAKDNPNVNFTTKYITDQTAVLNEIRKLATEWDGKTKLEVIASYSFVEALHLVIRVEPLHYLRYKGFCYICVQQPKRKQDIEDIWNRTYSIGHFLSLGYRIEGNNYFPLHHPPTIDEYYLQTPSKYHDFWTEKSIHFSIYELVPSSTASIHKEISSIFKQKIQAGLSKPFHLVPHLNTAFKTLDILTRKCL